MYKCLMYQKTIAAAGSEVTSYEHLRDRMTVHSIEYAITGDGTVTITAYTSISGPYNWIKDIIVAKGLTKTSGPDANGIGILDVFLHPAEFVRFMVESSTADAVVSIHFVQK